MQNSDHTTGAKSPHTGTLYIVATPIGNLADISRRAEEILSQVSVIAAEDTRHTRQLLDHFGINASLQAYHDFSDMAKTEQLLQRLVAGDSVALVSDAGTPLISDPGFKLVREARQRSVPVIPIPGASAVTAALSVAGLPTDRFVFEGFLPAKEGPRKARLQELSQETRTLVFYESPHRIAAAIEAMGHCLGQHRGMFLAREMTKKFEEHFFGTLGECSAWLSLDANHQKGEFVVIVAGADEGELAQKAQESALELVLTLREDVSLKRAVALVSQLLGVRKNELYSRALLSEGEKGSSDEPD